MDDFFDAAFAHSVLMHLKDPLLAVQEVRRVLKVKGVFGARDSDWTAIYANSNELLERSLALSHSRYVHRGTNLQFGRRLRGILNRAGFHRVAATASCDSFGTPETVRQWAQVMVKGLQDADLVNSVIESGRADLETLDRMKVAWKEWGEHPESFRAVIKCEAVGWKE